jgi:hypothetical protein
VFGPLGVRGFFGFMPGPDRRHGVLIDRQPYIQDNLHAAIGVFDPYSILLSPLFGAGVDAPAHVSAATVYAAKIDYALAANLTIEASLFKALRNSDGYGWGYIRPTPTTKGTYGTVLYETAGDFVNPSPSIPDRDLGWEVTAGVTWKLIEGFSLGGTVACWRPGRWFSYACVDKSVVGWNAEKPGERTAANNWGVNPNRTIDPIVGLEIRFAASY